MTEPQTMEELQAAQAEEYGAYVATTQIYIGNALAFDVGDPVPASTVDAGTVPADSVAKAGSKAAKGAGAPRTDTNPKTSPGD